MDANVPKSPGDFSKRLAELNLKRGQALAAIDGRDCVPTSLSVGTEFMQAANRVGRVRGLPRLIKGVSKGWTAAVRRFVADLEASDEEVKALRQQLAAGVEREGTLVQKLAISHREKAALVNECEALRRIAAGASSAVPSEAA